jgi:rod shape determining protein RodA
VYSSGISSDGVLQNNEYIKQIIWVSMGVVVLIGVSFFDYERLRAFSFYIYLGMLLMLILVLFFGDVVNGARSWLSLRGIGFQPSEFMKIALIIRLAVFFENTRNRYTDLVRFILSMVQTAVPMLLILLQPDMGTALVYLPIFLVMSFIAGIKKRYLIFIIAVGTLTILFFFIPAWDIHIATEKSLRMTKILVEERNLLVIISSLIVVFLISGAGYIFIKKRRFYWIG